MQLVKIYTTSYCGFCSRAKSFLKHRGVAFEEIDVTGNDAMREKLVEMSGGRKTVPQIFIGARAIGGYTDLVALDSSGELNALLRSPAVGHQGGRMASKTETGTRDVTYNIISILYHALGGAETYSQFIADAKQSGDDELVEFLQDVQSKNREIADRAKSLLSSRMAGAKHEAPMQPTAPPAAH